MARYLTVLTPDESGGYTADVPCLPGCVTYGRTVEGALANARKAIALYLDGEDAESLAVAGAAQDVIVATVEVPAAVPA